MRLRVRIIVRVRVWLWVRARLGFKFTVVKRVKFAKVKRNTSKLRLLLSLSKV